MEKINGKATNYPQKYSSEAKLLQQENYARQLEGDLCIGPSMDRTKGETRKHGAAPHQKFG
jgi:hypothetical protein